jgi:hypothetical protein
VLEAKRGQRGKKGADRVLSFFWREEESAVWRDIWNKEFSASIRPVN